MTMRAVRYVDFPAQFAQEKAELREVFESVFGRGEFVGGAAIEALEERHGLGVIEDAAQSIGSRYEGANSGTFGTCAAFSTHPLKNLNAAGDGGFLATNDPAIAHKARLLRNHGLEGRDTVTTWGTV